ncbi:hypothetical protein RhiirA5_398433 [Rhizophagus irregularis]|uniref:Uncharacterized protein n=1 Tax=Rhizophagus irregularis TaxID=588596 RepID=A0A2N0PSU3_9GLOM|nr:hypothetical protein RhiirA5_398433 [Rhizophagus irregularis]
MKSRFILRQENKKLMSYYPKIIWLLSKVSKLSLSSSSTSAESLGFQEVPNDTFNVWNTHKCRDNNECSVVTLIKSKLDFLVRRSNKRQLFGFYQEVSKESNEEVPITSWQRFRCNKIKQLRHDAFGLMVTNLTFDTMGGGMMVQLDRLFPRITLEDPPICIPSQVKSQDKNTFSAFIFLFTATL